MRNAPAVFVGKHDFTCFLASGSDVKDAVRTIFSLEITERGDDLSLSVTGDGFLYNMVRILAGTLLEAAKGKRTPADCARAPGGERPLSRRENHAREGAVSRLCGVRRAQYLVGECFRRTNWRYFKIIKKKT